MMKRSVFFFAVMACCVWRAQAVTLVQKQDGMVYADIESFAQDIGASLTQLNAKTWRIYKSATQDLTLATDATSVFFNKKQYSIPRPVLINSLNKPMMPLDALRGFFQVNVQVKDVGVLAKSSSFIYKVRPNLKVIDKDDVAIQYAIGNFVAAESIITLSRKASITLNSKDNTGIIFIGCSDSQRLMLGLLTRQPFSSQVNKEIPVAYRFDVMSQNINLAPWTIDGNDALGQVAPKGFSEQMRQSKRLILKLTLDAGKTEKEYTFDMLSPSEALDFLGCSQ